MQSMPFMLSVYKKKEFFVDSEEKTQLHSNKVFHNHCF